MGTRRPFPTLPSHNKVILDVIQLKAHVKHLEMNRVSAMLKNLKDDEIRLTKCIDDVEVFHRNMFVLLNTENKTAENEPENKTADDKNKFVVNYNPSVTEQDFSMNQPESSVFQPNYSMNQSECFPREELPEGMFEKIDSSDYELDDSEDKSHDMQDNSDDIKDNSTIDQKEMVEKAVLDLLADGEREITKLVLDLIFRFSGFQRSLQETETKVSRLKMSYNESIDDVKSMLKRLSWSILYFDNTVSKIYTKYLEMLKNISLRKDV